MKPVRGPEDFENLSWKSRDYSPMEIAEFARRIADRRSQTGQPLFDTTEKRAFVDILSEVIEKTSSVQVTSATDTGTSPLLQEPDGGALYYLHCVFLKDSGDLVPLSPTIAVHPEDFPNTNHIAFGFGRETSPLLELGPTIERMMLDYLRR